MVPTINFRHDMKIYGIESSITDTPRCLAFPAVKFKHKNLYQIGHLRPFH